VWVVWGMPAPAVLTWRTNSNPPRESPFRDFPVPAKLRSYKDLAVVRSVVEAGALAW
jgi:hypothetical protein